MYKASAAYIIISIFTVILTFFSFLLIFVLDNIPLFIVSIIGILFLQMSYFLAKKKKYLLIYSAFSLYTIGAIITSAYILEPEFQIVHYLVILVPFSFTLLYENISNRLMIIVSSLTILILVISYVVFYNISDSVNPDTSSSIELLHAVRVFNGAAIVIMVFIFIMLFIYKLERAKSVVNDMVEKLDYEVNHDYLTGLFSRRFADKLFCKMKHSDHSIWVLVIDIDQFKDINDRYGHDAGDQVLKAISNVILDCKEENDYIIRWGGDEFLIILCNKNESFVELYSKKIIEKINAIKIPVGNHLLSVHISLGYAKYQSDKTVDEAIQQADRAMYQTKFSKYGLTDEI